MTMHLLAGVVAGVLISGGAIAGALEECAAAKDRQAYAEALRLCRPLAERGNADAQTTLGVIYEDDLDDAKAVKWYRRAADQGNADAQFRLGTMYGGGRGGLARDDAEAAKWQRTAAEQGNADAQEKLGSMYEHGQGVPQSDVEAVKWYRKAAEQGSAHAQIEFGIMNEDGRGGLAPDYVEAVKWYRKAAEQGNADAQATLGFRYERGQGVSLDYVLAHMWLSLAAAKGYPCADKRDNLASKMTPTQIAEAQRLARDWKPAK
jgi:TPR repeat protein